MKKSFLLLSALLMAFLLTACGSEDDQASKSGQDPEPNKARTETTDEAAPAQAASFAYLFRPTDEEKALLDAGPAVNKLDTVNGFFTNPQGVSGYFQNFEKPFNFVWSGKTESLKAFDGNVYQVMSGPGLMVLKYLDEDQLLQRYEGETGGGLLNGSGEQWSRNNQVEGHHYYSFRGELRHDQMEGRGTITDYDFSAQDVPPVRYEGGLRSNLFHGRGRIFDLTTGETIREGLWLANEPFEGSEEEWRRAVEEYDLENPESRYRDVLMTDDLILDGLIDDESGELIIIAPPDAENVRAVDQTGHQYAFKPGSHLEDLGYGGEWFRVFGSIEKRPLADYPLTIDVSYRRNDKNHFLRFTALKPFGIVILAPGSGSWPDEDHDLILPDGEQVTTDW